MFDTGALAVSVDGHWQVRVQIIRESATVARVAVVSHLDSATKSSDASYATVTVANWTSNRTLKITGTAINPGAATNDIVCTMAKIKWEA